MVAIRMQHVMDGCLFINACISMQCVLTTEGGALPLSLSLSLSLTYSGCVRLSAACVFGRFNSDASNSMLLDQSKKIIMEEIRIG